MTTRSTATDSLFRLLPTIVRKRDGEQGRPLEAVLHVIGEQSAAMESNIWQLYEDAFVETAAPTLIPYLGEVVGVPPTAFRANDADDALRIASRLRRVAPRRQAANSARHFRRKGSLAVLEELARAIADWPARAVEFNDLALATATASVTTADPTNPGATVNARDAKQVAQVDTAFDGVAHTVDTRGLQGQRLAGRYHFRNVGLYAWPIPVHSMTRVRPHCLGKYPVSKMDTVTLYALDPAGWRRSLFVHPDRETDPSQIAEERNVPTPLTLALLRDPADTTIASSEFYGEGRSLRLFLNDELAARENVRPVGLGPVAAMVAAERDGSTAQSAEGKRLVGLLQKNSSLIMVDPERGLIATASARKIESTHHYAFNASIGGGEYRRPPTFRDYESVERYRFSAEESIDSSDAFHTSKIRQARPFLEFTRVNGSERDITTLASRFDDGHLLVKATPCHKVSAVLIFEGKEIELPVSGDEARSRQRGVWRFVLEGHAPDDVKEIRLDAQSNVETFQSYWELERHTGDVIEPRARDTIIELNDSDVHRLNANLIVLSRGKSLTIMAKDQQRPTLQLSPGKACEPGLRVLLAPGSRLELDGLRIQGGDLHLQHWWDADLVTSSAKSIDCHPVNAKATPPVVVIRHCTYGIIPKQSECGCRGVTLLLSLPNSLVRVEHSILGPIGFGAEPPWRQQNPRDVMRLALQDSIIDAGDRTYAIDSRRDRKADEDHRFDLRIHRCTIRGRVHARRLDIAQDSIFLDKLIVGRPQTGGMRYCYVHKDSTTPPQYYCQPSLSTARGQSTNTCGETLLKLDCEQREATSRTTPAPIFASLDPLAAAYMRLAPNCPVEIRRGAEDESEMGVFHDLYEPHREANLRERLKQFTPVSMRSEILYAYQ